MKKMTNSFWWWPDRVYEVFDLNFNPDLALPNEDWDCEDGNWLAIREQLWSEREGLA